MRVLADAAEEAGDSVLAEGWRRMAKLRMFPDYRRRPRLAVEWGWACKYRLPSDLTKRIGGLRRLGVRPPKTFSSPDHLRLMEDTARAVGGWPAECFRWADERAKRTGEESHFIWVEESDGSWVEEPLGAGSDDPLSDDWFEHYVPDEEDDDEDDDD
jgi:hypothetical protein